MIVQNGEQHTDQFIQAFQSGDEAAFDLFFRRHFQSLCFFANKILNNEEEAKDIVQNSFIKLWKISDTIKNRRAIKSYLYMIVRNECLDKVKKIKKETGVIKSISIPEDEWDGASISEVVYAETIKRVYDMIEELPKKMREVFKLYYVSGKNYSEIAATLHTSPETIRKQRMRALTLLKGKLQFIALLFLLLFN